MGLPIPPTRWTDQPYTASEIWGEKTHLPFGCTRHPRKALGHKLYILGGGFKDFLFSPLFGEDFQFDDHIFQMG